MSFQVYKAVVYKVTYNLISLLSGPSAALSSNLLI